MRSILSMFAGSVQFGAQQQPSRLVNFEATLVATGNAQIVGMGNATSPSTVGTTGTANGTATEGPAFTLAAAALASLSPRAKVSYSDSGTGTGPFTFGQTIRFTCRFKVDTFTSVRWWVGLFNGPASALSVTDTPAFSFAAFRASAGTDVRWTALASDGVTIASVDTGIALDTGVSHLFEIVPVFSSNGVITSLIYFIDGVAVASISTPLPTPANPCNMTVTGDNKNTATAQQLNFHTLGVLVNR